MRFTLDEAAMCERLRTHFDDAQFQRGLAALTSDAFFVAFFLASVSQGEGLGEAAVAIIGQDELARHIRDLQRQEAEERGHKLQTIEAATDLFGEFFESGTYRYPDALQGITYYETVLAANRTRLKHHGRYSKLNLYLTTTLGYEVMVVLYYRAVADALRAGSLPDATKERVAAVLESILAEEETHVGVVDQHQALLEVPRASVSAEARTLLEALERIGPEDYDFAAQLSVLQVVEMTQRYAEPEAYRAAIEATAH